MHIPDINRKIKRVNNFPFQICYDIDNCFKHLNGLGRAYDSEIQDIIQDFNKHDNLVKIHEEFLRGKGCNVDANSRGWLSAGFSVVQPMHIISILGDTTMVASLDPLGTSDNIYFLQDVKEDDVDHNDEGDKVNDDDEEELQDILIGYTNKEEDELGNINADFI